MRGNNFIFYCAILLYYKCHKINFIRIGSYIDSPDWIKMKKKTTINTKKKDDKYFQNVATIALNFDGIKKDPQGVSNIKPLINKYNWKGINYLSKMED